jgi:SAM-dependent methyltransferase
VTAASRDLSERISPRFLALLEAEGLGDKRVLDVGCGRGRLALRLAPAARHVVGLDRDPALIEEARSRAERAGLVNAEFHLADVEAAEYAPWRPSLVAAHLCASDAIVERAARALPPGGCLGLVAFHVDQWRETGRASRFAYDEARMAGVLAAHGLAAEVIEVDREVRRFGSVEEALAGAVGLEERWRADGRWFRYIAFLESGGRTLTRSHLIVKARRR